MNLPQLSHDKANHFVYGAVASVAGGFFFGPIGAVGAAAIVGVVKEVLDKVLKTGVFDPMDIAATAAGGLPVAAVLALLA